jgi:hypothetical protein
LQRWAQQLDRLSQCLERNAKDLTKNDAYCRACQALDELEQRLAKSGMQKQCPVCQGKNSARCSACKGNSSSQGFVRGGGRGGHKAGRGTAGDWRGATLRERGTERLGEVVPDQERDGRLSVVSPSISTEEDAESALRFKEKFADFVEQAEADLDLESVPLAYREYLRRYFTAIRQDEQESEAEEP